MVIVAAEGVARVACPGRRDEGRFDAYSEQVFKFTERSAPAAQPGTNRARCAAARLEAFIKDNP
jgi:hypothetical protein